MIDVADTYRAAGKFPVANGYWTSRVATPVPSASSLPAMTCLVDPYGRWIRTDGTHWDLVGVAPNVVHLDPAACALDVGAAINAADARLGAAMGVIVIPDGDAYEWTESAQLSSNRVLMLGHATFNLHNTGAPAIYLDKTNNTYIVGRGWSTILNESDAITTDGTALASVFIGFNTDDSTGNNYGDCFIVDFALVGSGVFATLAAGAGASSAISCGNAKRVRIENVKIVGTHYIGINVGGASPGAGGDYADSVVVTGCHLENIQAVFVAGVNVSNYVVTRNTFLGGPNALASAVDLEANLSSDRLQNFVIADNVFDVGEAQGSTWYGISVQGGLDTPGDSPDLKSYYASDNGVIANNQFYGYRGGFQLNYAVFLANCKDILVVGNNSKGGGNLEFENCRRCVAANNRFRFPSGNAWITFFNSLYCIADGNWFFNAAGEENGTSNQILENGTSDFNVFKDNFVAASSGDTQLLPTTAANANILLSGAHSREWDNYLGEVALGGGMGQAGRTKDGVFEDYRGMVVGDRAALVGQTIRPRPAPSDNECGLLPVQPTSSLTSYTPSPALSWGVRFTVAEHCYARALRFYKDPGDATTSHTLYLWDESNGLSYGAVAKLHTSSEPVSGWHTQALASAVELIPGRNYIVSIDYNGTFTATYKNDSSYPYTRGPATVSAALSGSLTGMPATNTGATNQPLVDVVMVTANPKAVNVKERLNTTTGAEDVLTVAAPQPGNWLIGCTYRVVGGATDVDIVATWKDANNATQTATIASAAAQPIGTYTATPVFVNTDAIVPGTLKVTATSSVASRLVVSASAALL